MSIDPALTDLACKLAQCSQRDLMGAAWRGDHLVVVVQPGQKHIYTPHQVAEASAQPGELRMIKQQQPTPEPEPEPEPEPPAPKGKARR